MKKQKNGKNNIKFGDTIPVYFSFTAVLMILESCINTFYVGVFSENYMGLIRGFPRCLQGVMMIIVIRVFDTVMGTAITNTLAAVSGNADANAAITDLIYTMLLGAIALVMAVVKSGSWAKSVMDAM